MDKLCVDKLCVDKLCVSIVWEEAAGGGGRSREQARVPN